VNPSLARSIDRAVAAEDDLDRFERLSRMNTVELARTLGGDVAASLPWVRAAAVHGVEEAQLRLGRMLLDGTGVPRDQAAALGWFRRALRADDGEAANMVGRCHENGWGTAACDEEAARWYRRAAEAGDVWGAYNYAHMLFDGRGVPIDRVAAFRLYEHAAGRGHARAMNLAGRCLDAGWGTSRDPAAAARWYERSAEAGYFRAQFNHALALLERGAAAEALSWLDRAADGGDDAIRAQVATVRGRLARSAQSRAQPAAAGTSVPRKACAETR
jgi:TPR repeat protein